MRNDMLTDYDIQRLSSAIVRNLVNDEKFMRRMAKMIPKKKNMVSSSRAASILGISRKTVCCIAEHLGGIKGRDSKGHWVFEEDGLVERYIEYKNKEKK